MKKRVFKLKVILLASTLLSIVGCGNNVKTTTNDTSNPNKAVVKAGCDTSITSDEISFKALAIEVFKADTNLIKSLFLDPVVLKMEKKTGDQGGEYYLYNFEDGVNKIVLFRNDEGFYLEDAEIKNSRVRLNKNISISMGKDALLKLLKFKKIACDTIKVDNEEQTFSAVYIFKDAKLQQIKMGQTLE
jgi:hypothetical protein